MSQLVCSPFQAAWETSENEASTLNVAPSGDPKEHSTSLWPSDGVVSFQNYSTRYREGLDLALSDITFTTKPAEKVCRNRNCAEFYTFQNAWQSKIRGRFAN